MQIDANWQVDDMEHNVYTLCYNHIDLTFTCKIALLNLHHITRGIFHLNGARTSKSCERTHLSPMLHINRTISGAKMVISKFTTTSWNMSRHYATQMSFKITSKMTTFKAFTWNVMWKVLSALTIKVLFHQNVKHVPLFMYSTCCLLCPQVLITSFPSLHFHHSISITPFPSFHHSISITELSDAGPKMTAHIKWWSCVCLLRGKIQSVQSRVTCIARKFHGYLCLW